MRSKLKWIIPAVLLLAIVVVYLVPTPKRTFDQLASAVPPDKILGFKAFRQSYAVHRLEVNGYKWEYIAVGKGTETFVFLHGMTGAYDIWWQQIEALQDNFRVISVTFPPVDTLEGLSQGILAIMDAEQVDKVDLVGTSLGGYLAQYMVAKHPERILRVIFANTFPPNDVIRQQNGTVGTLLPFLPEWLIMRTLRSSVQESIYPASGEDAFTLAYLTEMVSGRMSKAQVIARYHAVIEPFTPADPIGQGIMAMIIESDNDPLVNAELRAQLRATYPGALIYGLKNAGHFPYLNHPEDYLNLIEVFLQMPIMQ